MIFLGTVITVVFAKGWFSMSIIPSLFMNWKSFHFPLIYLFNHVLISVWTHVYLLYALGYTLILLYLFCCTNCSNFSHWVLFQVGSWIPLACLIFYHWTFSALWYYKILQAHLIHFLPYSISPRRILFRNQDLGTRCYWSHCF